MKESNTTTVFGSYGSFEVNPITGGVVSMKDAEKEYKQITKIDVKEFLTFWNEKKLDETVDILDIAYWEGEKYIKPESTWREEIKKDKMKRINE